MIDESMDKEQMQGPPQPWEFRAKAAWKRLIIMIGGVTVNFILGFFLFAMVLWGWGREYIPTAELKQYGMSYDSLFLQNGFQQGDLILRVGDKPFERLDGNDFRKAVMLDGIRQATVLRNGTETSVSFSDDFANKLPKVKKKDLIAPRVPFVIDTAVAGKPAATAGLKKGDRLISINGSPIQYFDEFRPAALSVKDKTVPIGYVRSSGDTVVTNVAVSEHGTIGVAVKMDGYFKTEVRHYSLAQALPAGVGLGWTFLTDQINAFGQMFKGKLSVTDNLGSVISIGKLFDPAWDWRVFWTVTASLSIILAFMNLLPIPALDGGYVMFLIWEVVTGRKVSDKFMERAITIGFFLLIGLMVFALGLDLWRLF